MTKTAKKPAPPARGTNKKGEQIVAQNRAASYNYHLLERLEAGLVLHGTEVKALREGKGCKGSPYRFKRNSILAGGLSIGHEWNSTSADAIHATPHPPARMELAAQSSEEVIDDET